MSHETNPIVPPQQGDSKRENSLIYKVQIDRQVYELRDPTPTGEQLLVLAGKVPTNQFALYEKPQGGQPIRIGLEQRVDLREPGIERFVTLPLDQTEGLGSRRQFTLPEDDLNWLEGCGLRYELVVEGGVLRVVVYDFPLRPGYNHEKVAVSLRIDAGYPDSQIDMAYFFPPIERVDKRVIPAISPEAFDGLTWQRWSRHRTSANPWRPGVDNLGTHMALVEDWLARELKKA
jgi:hypothetical protein